MVEPKTLARPYAKAIFSLAKDCEPCEQWFDLLLLLVMLVTHRDVQKVIKNQTISSKVKADFVIDLAGNKISSRGANLVKILAQNSRLNLLPEIASIFKELQQAAEQQLLVRVKVANNFSDLEKDQLFSVLKKKFNKDLELDFVQDEKLLAGLTLQVKDSVTDFSLYGQLGKLRRVLKG